MVTRSLSLSLAFVVGPMLLDGQQTAGLLGTLRDRASQQPIPNAAITIVGKPVLLRTDTTGRFSLDHLTPGLYVVQARALGYTPGSRIVELGAQETLAVLIELEVAPFTLPDVTVEGRRVQAGLEGFERRRLRREGVFLTEDDIIRSNAARLSDVLRMTPGVRLICRAAGCRVRMSRGECQPDYVVDGSPANNSTSPEMPVIGLIAVEIYRTVTETPLEFLRTDNTCGTIVIWTRKGL